MAKLMKGGFTKYHPAICTNFLNWLIDLMVIIAWLIVIYNKADSTSVSYYLSLFISFPCNGYQFNDIRVTACYVVVKYMYIEKKNFSSFLTLYFSSHIVDLKGNSLGVLHTNQFLLPGFEILRVTATYVIISLSLQKLVTTSVPCKLFTMNSSMAGFHIVELPRGVLCQLCIFELSRSRF